jgi:hypothetical protein
MARATLAGASRERSGRAGGASFILSSCNMACGGRAHPCPSCRCRLYSQPCLGVWEVGAALWRLARPSKPSAANAGLCRF